MIKIFDNPEELSTAAAELIVTSASEAIAKRGRFTISLSGGSTPKRAFEILAQPEFKRRIDWAKVHVFWGDERCVPFDHPDSNAGMTFKALLDHVPVPKEQIHKINGSIAPHDAALEYEEVIRSYFKENEVSFDLVLLGMGTDGHTASLFPYTPVLEEKAHFAKEVYLEELEKFRITLTKTIINNASKIVFLVAGENKAQVLNEVMFGNFNPHKLPSQLIKPVFGELVWLLDKPASQEVAGKIA